MAVIEIPGGTATLRDKLTVGGRDRLEVAIFAVQRIFHTLPKEAEVSRTRDLFRYVPPEDVRTVQTFNRTLLLAYLKSWDLEEDMPRTVEDCDEMEQDVYDAILAKANDLFGINRKATNFDLGEGAEDPKAPTDSSSSSEQPDEERPKPSTEIQVSDGSPTSTGAASPA